MEPEQSKWWKKITLRRHRSELRALRKARLRPQMGIFSIFLCVGRWYFAFALPPGVVLVTGVELIQDQRFLAHSLGLVMFGAGFLGCLALGAFALPWFHRWSSIARELTSGRTAKADLKELELEAAIAAAEREGFV